MKTKIFFSVLICFSFLKVNGQEKTNEPTTSTNLPTLAVANPYVNGLTFKAETVSKMIRLELIKMKKYNKLKH